jgi:type II secretory pathway pseudopilin PulG
LEVMVALAILGISITVIVELLSGDLRLARKSQEFSRAVFYGHQLLEELSIRQDYPKNQEEGVFEGNFRWRYVIDTIPVVTEEQEERYPVRVFKITVNVFWPGKGGDKRLSFETLRTLAKKEESPWNKNSSLRQKEKSK